MVTKCDDDDANDTGGGDDGLRKFLITAAKMNSPKKDEIDHTAPGLVSACNLTKFYKSKWQEIVK